MPGTPVNPAPLYVPQGYSQQQTSNDQDVPGNLSSSSSSSSRNMIGNLDDLDDLHLGRHNALLRIIDGMRIAIDRRLNGLEQSTQVLANNQHIFNDSLNNLQGTLTDTLNAGRNSEHNSFLVGQDVIRLRNEVTNTQGLVNNV